MHKISHPTKSEFPQPLIRQSLFSQRGLIICAAFSAIGLVYASVLPVQYRYMPLSEAWERFLNIPWLNLGLGRRADWVANGLAILPFGFFAAGAVDARSKTDGTYLCWIAMVMVTGALLAVGIEFLQLWFPIRTKSLNDIVAGLIGALSGPLLWLLIGRPLLRKPAHFDQEATLRNAVHQRFGWLLAAYCVSLVGYSVLPLDIMLNANEWHTKFAAGRFEWAPHSASLELLDAESLARTFLEILKSAVLMIPPGFLAVLALSKRHCVLLILVLPVAIEILQAPVFTRHTVYTDVLSGWVGGLAGMLLVRYRNLLVGANQHLSVRLFLVMATTVTLVYVFLGGTTEIRSTPNLAEAWKNFFTPPFAKYYFMDEFNAFSNAAKKSTAFAVLGFFTGNLLAANSLGGKEQTQYFRFAAAFTFFITLSAAIEITQVYLSPFVGDASDAILYTAASTGGWFLYQSSDWARIRTWLEMGTYYGTSNAQV